MLMHITARSKAMTFNDSIAAVERSPPHWTTNFKPLPSKLIRPEAVGPTAARITASKQVDRRAKTVAC